MTRLRPMLGWAALCCALSFVSMPMAGSGAAATPSSPAPTATAVAAAVSIAAPGTAEPTDITRIRPTDPAGHRLSGYRVHSTRSGATCEPASQVVAGAFSCLIDGDLLDPCWLENAAHLRMLCMSSPRASAVIRIMVSRLEGFPPDLGGRFLWGLTLEDGRSCSYWLDNYMTFYERPVVFGCNWLMGLQGIDRHELPWQLDTVRMDHTGDLHRGPTLGITGVVIGRKSWQPPL